MSGDCELLQNMVEDLDKAALLIAACVHDLDHMGRTSSFLVNAEHPLALLYNDMLVHLVSSRHFNHTAVHVMKAMINQSKFREGKI